MNGWGATSFGYDQWSVPLHRDQEIRICISWDYIVMITLYTYTQYQHPIWACHTAGCMLGQVEQWCNMSATVLLIKFLPSLPVTAERGSTPSVPYPPQRATSGIATCSVVGDTYRPVAKLSPAWGWWTLPCLACLLSPHSRSRTSGHYLWATYQLRP